MTVSPEKIAEMLAGLDRCPTCQCNWIISPPAKIEDSGRIKTGQARCVNCKAVYDDPDIQREILTTLRSQLSGMTEETSSIRRKLQFIADEARQANATIALNRDGGGQGRVRVATAMHRIAKAANEALGKEPTHDQP